MVEEASPPEHEMLRQVAREAGLESVKNLSKENLSKELEFFKQDFAKGFERTYGWAWLMKLYSEVLTWDNTNAKIWASNMKPLVDLLSKRTIDFLDNLSKCINGVGE